MGRIPLVVGRCALHLHQGVARLCLQPSATPQATCSLLRIFIRESLGFACNNQHTSGNLLPAAVDLSRCDSGELYVSHRDLYMHTTQCRHGSQCLIDSNVRGAAWLSETKARSCSVIGAARWTHL